MSEKRPRSMITSWSRRLRFAQRAPSHVASAKPMTSAVKYDGMTWSKISASFGCIDRASERSARLAAGALGRGLRLRLLRLRFFRLLRFGSTFAEAVEHEQDHTDRDPAVRYVER